MFRARQRSMQRIVALKISRDRSIEPQTLAQLEHPHIVRVFDQRQLPEHKLRLLYMQYVPGGTLQSVVAHARSLPAVPTAVACFWRRSTRRSLRNGEEPPADSLTRYACKRKLAGNRLLARRAAGRALAHAHQQGVLHRDIKPANVLVGADGQPKLADFNISFSKLDGATPAAYFGGTLAYMSPEQLEAYDPAHARQPEELDGRSDIYSLGVVLWELLTLRRPFADFALPEDWSLALARMIGPAPRGDYAAGSGARARRLSDDRRPTCCSSASPPIRPTAFTRRPSWPASSSCACSRGPTRCCTAAAGPVPEAPSGLVDGSAGSGSQHRPGPAHHHLHLDSNCHALESRGPKRVSSPIAGDQCRRLYARPGLHLHDPLATVSDACAAGPGRQGRTAALARPGAALC